MRKNAYELPIYKPVKMLHFRTTPLVPYMFHKYYTKISRLK